MSALTRRLRQHLLQRPEEQLTYLNRELIPLTQEMAQRVQERWGNTTQVTEDYNVLLTDEFLVVDASAAAVTLSLPSVDAYTGIMTVKKTDVSSNTVTLSPDGSETIDGQSSWVLTAQWDSVRLFNDGTEWLVFRGGSSFATGGNIDLYVNPTDADAADTNAGTAAAPLSTLGEAVRRLNAFTVMGHRAIIHLGPHPSGGHVWNTALKERVMRANIYIVGDGGGGSTDGFTELVSSSDALAGSGAGVVVSTGLTVNAYRGKTIEIQGGDAAGDRRTIRNNTATDIIPCTEFSAAVATGDPYRVIEPAILLDVQLDEGGGEATTPLCVGCGHPDGIEMVPAADVSAVWFVNLDVQSSDSSSIGILHAPKSHVRFFGIELNDVIWRPLAPNGKITAGIEAYTQQDSPFEAVQSAVDDLGAVANTSWVGWGLASSTAFTPAGGRQFYHGLVAPSLSVRYGVDLHIRSGNIYGSGDAPALTSLSGEDSSTFIYLTNFNTGIAIWIGGGQDADREAIFVRDGRIIMNNVFGGFVVTGGSSETAVRVEKAGLFIFEGDGTGIAFDGDFGLVTRNGGRILAETLPTGTTTTADFSEDGGVTTRAFSTMTNDSHFPDGNGAWIGRI